MGLLPSRLSETLEELRTSRARILVLGLDAAGKTTILYRLKLDKHVMVIPTVGFNVEKIKSINNVTFTMWDIGGGEKIKQLLYHYYEGTEGVLFIVDSADVERISEVRQEIFTIFKDDRMVPGCPFVVLANKQDLPNALKAKELADRIGLYELKDNPWHVQEVSAYTGDGLNEGIEKLAHLVKNFQNKGKT